MPIYTKKTTKAPEKVPLCVELPGLEPRTTEPKSAVLPLHHSSNKLLVSGGKGK